MSSIRKHIFNISDADVPDLEVIFGANAVDFYICVFICICMCFETRYEGLSMYSSRDASGANFHIKYDPLMFIN